MEFGRELTYIEHLLNYTDLDTSQYSMNSIILIHFLYLTLFYNLWRGLINLSIPCRAIGQ